VSTGKVSIVENADGVKSKLVIEHHPFLGNMMYKVTIPAGAVNGLTSDISWTFSIPLAPMTYFPDDNDGGYGIEVSSVSVWVQFNTPITINPNQVSKITVTKEKGAIPTEITVTGATIDPGDDKKLTIATVGSFVLGTTYKVTIPSGVFTEYSEEVTWTFTTKRPSYNYNPEKWETGVGNNQLLKVIFDEPVVLDDENKIKDIKINVVKIKEVDGKWQEIETEEGDEVEVLSAVIDDADKKTLSITHAPFVAGTSYKVLIPARVVNGQETTIPSGDPWIFTTLAAQPQTFIPAKGATNVGLDATVSLEFDGIIVEGYRFDDIEIRRASDDVRIETSGRIDEANGKLLIIDHADFEPSTVYKAFIPGWATNGKTTDIPRATETPWTFTTAAPVSLSGATFTPAKGAEGVALDVNPKVVFPNRVSIGGKVNFKITAVATGEEMIGVSGELDETGTILTIKHTERFAPDTQYRVTIPKNSLIGLTDDFDDWTFTTSFGVVSINPKDGASEVALDAPMYVEFNMDVVKSGSGEVTFSPSVSGVQSSVQGKRLNIAHGDFNIKTTYTVTIPANMLQGQTKEIKWSFKTIEVLSVGEINKLEAKLYPNPVQSGAEFTIQIDDNSHTPRIIEIFNATGALVTITETSGSLIQLTAPKEPGVYLLRFTIGKQTGTYRLMVY